MCGLAGALRARGVHRDPAADRAVLARMGRQLARRGPDEETVFVDDQLALVFRRLAIIDQPGGSQPFVSEDGALVLVLNGEIYNHRELRAQLEPAHRFVSRCDAEVVLHLFEDRGTDAFAELNGMFALALWDLTRRRLVLARDRLGIKPLVLARPDATRPLLFGSELKALLVHPDAPRELDFRPLATSRIRPYGPGGVPTYVRGVEHLPGGTFLEVDAAGDAVRVGEPRAYWTIDRHFAGVGAATSADASAAIDRYEEVFADAVKLELMSDGPVGLLLSGGLDSSLVAAAAHRAGGHVHCFTAVVDASNAETGDADAARDLARTLGLPLHAVTFDPDRLLDELDFGLDHLEYFVWLLDAPFFTLELLFKHELHRYARTVVPDLKVMLLGQGADEFAGGYSRSLAGDQPWSAYVHQELRRQTRIETLVAREVPEPLWPYLSPALGGPDDPARAEPAFHREMRRRVVFLQAKNLWHEDRAAAIQGVEARVPFLDHRLVELLAQVPPALHARLFEDKAIVREVARRFLPERLTSRPKVPWLRTRDGVALAAFWARLRDRLLPEFCARYLRVPGALFAERAVLELAEKSRGSDEAAQQHGEHLMFLITVAIFDRMLRRLRDDDGPAGAGMMVPPSPLVAGP